MCYTNKKKYLREALMLFPPASPQKTYFFFFLFIMALVPSFTTHETTGTAPFAAPFATTTPASTVSLAACTIPLLTFFPASLLMASLKASATLGGSVSTSSSLSSNLGRGKEGRSVSFPCAGPWKKKKREKGRGTHPLMRSSSPLDGSPARNSLGPDGEAESCEEERSEVVGRGRSEEFWTGIRGVREVGEKKKGLRGTHLPDATAPLQVGR